MEQLALLVPKVLLVQMELMVRMEHQVHKVPKEIKVQLD